jgi:hypothetical protein
MRTSQSGDINAYHFRPVEQPESGEVPALKVMDVSNSK